MMGSQVAPAQLFYDFCLDDHVPDDYLLRKIDQFLDLESVRSELKPFYSTIGRPSIAPELMMRMLIIGYCMGIRSERPLWRRFTSTLPIDGSAVWDWTARFLTIPPSRATAMAASDRATSSDTSSRQSWNAGRWRRVCGGRQPHRCRCQQTTLRSGRRVVRRRFGCRGWSSGARVFRNPG